VELQNAFDRSAERAVRVFDPRTNAEYVVLPAERYERLREIEEDERLQRAIRDTAIASAARRSDEER
jgi:hypothetical protein